MKNNNTDNDVKSYKWVKLKNDPPKNSVLYVLDPETGDVELFITDKNGNPKPVKTEASVNIGDYVKTNSNNIIKVEQNKIFVKKTIAGDSFINIEETNTNYILTLNQGTIEFITNKQNNLTPDGTGTKYPTVDAVNEVVGVINERIDDIELTPGADGKSAYELAVEEGFIGTLDEWLDSLQGADGIDGKSAYQIWLDEGNTGTVEDFLESLVGKDGDKGDAFTYDDFTDSQLEALKGEDGVDGKSAYELWLDQGNTGTIQDFLTSLEGDDGLSAYEIALINGFVGTEVQWLQSLIGQQGLSAYQIWLQQGNVGSVQDFLDSLIGEDGYTPIKNIDYFDGANGDSAYQIWLDLGNVGTPQDFINSLQGDDGQAGSVVTIGTNNNWFIDNVDTGVKAVGEDGLDGYTPIKGIDYFDGTDGYTPQKGIDYFDGTDGKDGNGWFGGSSNPASSLGQIGDWYVNNTTWDVFEKTTSGVWTLRGNIKGGDGADGISGIISLVTASIGNSTGVPSVVVTLGGTPTNRTINLDFNNLKGDKGDKGEDGKGVRIVGTLPNPGALPTPPLNDDDAYLIDGDLWVWDSINNTWVNVGNIQGPAGPPGPANSLSIGTVVSGTTASATITGTAPSQTLNLVLPKGDNAPTYSATNGIQLIGTVFSPVYGSTVGTIAQGDDPRFHNAVTIGTANGLSLLNQVLSLGLASATSTGALSQADWIAFNSKASANDGNITYSGIGAIVGGGTSSANQSANTTYTFDLSQLTKDNIDLGVIANSWGDHSTFNYATQTWVTSNFAQIAHTHLTSHVTALTGYTLGTNSPLTTSDTLNQALGKLQAQINSKGGVTSITAGTGLSGGTITSSGTIALNSATIASLNLANSALQTGDNISELINDAGYITSASIPLYTAGTGINISPSYVITNTSPNINQTLSFVGGVLTLSNGGGSVTIPNDNTITRLRGTATGTYTSGDLTLLAGANTTITQSGANFTIASTNTTYGGGTLAQLNASTPDSTDRVWSPSILNQWLNGKGYLTTETDPIFTSSPAFGITAGDITNWNNKQNALTAGANIQIVGNTISATNTIYTLPIASASTLGGIRVGSNLTIDSNGILSATSTNVTQTLSITGRTVSLSAGGGSVIIPFTDWADIPNKPTTFTPSAHTHTTAQVTALTGYVLGTNTAISATDSLNVALGKIQGQLNGKTSNLGTVTSITAGTGLSGGTINTSGTIALNSTTLASLLLADSALQSGDNISELVNDANYATVGQLPTVGNGTLNMTTPIGLSVVGSFLANQNTNSTFSLTYASGYQGYTTAEANKLAGLSNYILPTASATVLGGVKVGTNLSIDANGVLSSSYVNTTYSAGNGLTLLGTIFSLPVTQTGTGNAVTDVTQTANGITVTKGSTFLTSFTETDPTVPTWVKSITQANINTWNAKQNALVAGANIQINPTTNVISATNTNTTYTSSNGILLTGTNFTPIYGTTAGTIAQGNDTRINNGQTAFGWGRGLRVDGNGAWAGGGTITGTIDAVRNASMYASGSASGKPGGLVNEDVTIVNFTSGNANISGIERYSGFDLVSSATTDKMWFRRENMAAGKSPWLEFIHSGNIGTYAQTLTAGLHTTITSNQVNVVFNDSAYVLDKLGNQRLFFSSTAPQNDMLFKLSQADGNFRYNASNNTPIGSLQATTGWNLNVGNYSVGEQLPTALNRNMGTAGGWARNMMSISHSGTDLDVMGYYGSGSIINYGYLGGLAYNNKNAIRWSPNGFVGIGSVGTTVPTHPLQVVTAQYEAISIQSVTASGGSAIRFANASNVTLGDIGFGVLSNDFTVRGATGLTLMRINQVNGVPYFPQLPAPQTGASNNLAIFDSGNGLWKSNVTIGDLVTTSSLGNYYTKTDANNNFHKLAKTLAEVSSGNFYTQINAQEANNILGNVSTYLGPSSTMAGVGIQNSHLISYGVNANYGFQLRHEASANNGLKFRLKINGNWTNEETFAYQSWVTQQITNAGGNYITTNTSQTGLTGNKTGTGDWTFRRVLTSRLGYFGTYDIAQTQGIWSIGSIYNVGTTNTNDLGTQYGLAYSYIDVGGSSAANQHQIHFVNNGVANVSVILANGLIRSNGGFAKIGQNDTQMLLAGGGHRPVSDFALTSSIPTINDYITTNTNQPTLSGNKTTSGIWDYTNPNGLYVSGSLGRVRLGRHNSDGDVSVGSSGIGSPPTGTTQEYGFYLAYNAFRDSDGYWKHSRQNSVTANIFKGGNHIQGFSWGFSPNVGAGNVDFTELMKLSNNGELKINSTSANVLKIERTNNTNTNIEYINSGISIFAGSTNGTSWAVGGTADLNTISTRWMWVDNTGLVSAKAGFSKTGATDADVLLGSGGHRPVSDFALAGSLAGYLPLGSNTTITSLSTGNVATQTNSVMYATTNAPNNTNSTVLSVNGHAQHYGWRMGGRSNRMFFQSVENAVSGSWIEMITTSNVSSYVPAQVNLIQGAGIGITGTYPNLTITNTAPNIFQTLSQSGQVVTLSNGGGSFTLPTNTTYTAGTGLSLTGTVFGQTITTSGTGTFVTGVTQTANGFQINLGTPPNTNTTYTAGAGLSLTGTTFANTAPNATHTGDVTGATALTIATSAVTLPKIQNIATQTFLGRATAGTGNVEALTATQVKTVLGIPDVIGNGVFTVQGTGALTGTGSTSANTNANTTATLDLTQATKNNIQAGVNANNIIPSVIEGVDVHYITTNTNHIIDIEQKKTIINVASGISQSLGASIELGDAPYIGYELAINGCSEWTIKVLGSITDRCGNSSATIVGSGSVLFWFTEGGWIQAI